MGDSLTRLVQRTLGMAPVVRPVLASRYAPGPVTAEDGLRASEEALPGEGADTSPDDGPPIPPAGTQPVAVFAPADSGEPQVGDERSRAGPFAPPAPARDIPRRHSESRAVDAPLTASSELREAHVEEKPSAVLSAPDNPSPALTPSDPEPLISASSTGTEDDSPAAEEAMPSSPGELSARQILRPRVVFSDERPVRAAEAPAIEGHRREVASESATAAPTIRVTIGRVEVRANLAPAPEPRSRPARPGPMLSLDDYLKRRDGGH